MSYQEAISQPITSKFDDNWRGAMNLRTTGAFYPVSSYTKPSDTCSRCHSTTNTKLVFRLNNEIVCRDCFQK